MSASLVGSEMCIRDRSSSSPTAFLSSLPSPPRSPSACSPPPCSEWLARSLSDSHVWIIRNSLGSCEWARAVKTCVRLGASQRSVLGP
eukprot:2896106-Alexandrium_andersonii.AAC.1